jgi:signal transduction histidine kinase
MNLFGISSLILSLSGIIFSFIIYRSDPKAKANRYWFISCISFSLWSLSLFGVTFTNNIQTALLWQYILDIAAVFLPATYFLFICEFLGYKNHKTRVGMITVATIISIFSFTPLWKIGMTKLGEFYWINPGPYYVVFPIYFASLAVICLTVLITSYLKAEKNSIRKGQVRNMLIAGFIGYAGGFTNFFPSFFNSYPFGNYLVIFYIVFMVYGVLKYKLLSTKVVSAQIFSTSLILGFLFILLRSSELTDWLINFGILIFGSFFCLLLLISFNKELRLRQDIEKLTISLKTLNQELLSLDTKKSEFISLASHQLRGPLTIYKGYSSMILEGGLGKIPKKVKTAVQQMMTTTESMEHLINNYLNIFKIEQNEIEYYFSKLNIKKEIEEVINGIMPKIKLLEINFKFVSDFKQGPFLIGDSNKLKEVILSLLENSIEYVEKGNIEVRLQEINSKLLITIKDDGLGINKDLLPTLFNKFIRGEHAKRKNVKGSGLGLFISKKIIEEHQGRIWAESEGEGKGSSFFIELNAA